jgi:hypothetical protein
MEFRYIPFADGVAVVISMVPWWWNRCCWRYHLDNDGRCHYRSSEVSPFAFRSSKTETEMEHQILIVQ